MTDLNDPQNQAVEHPGGPLLIFAGAGSGKTRVLTHRIARLVERGVEPADILAVTFTNKAAGEMEERLEKLIGKEAVDVLWLGTFHATGARILRALAAFTSRRADFSIYDEHDQLTVVKQAVEELHLDKKVFNAVEVRERITKAKEAALQPEDLPAGTELEIGFVRVWERYEKWLEAANAFDFEDLLLVPMRLAESDTEAGHKLRNRFEHVLVDEFQDTSKTQWRFVSALGRKTGNITVVGDDDQCHPPGVKVLLSSGEEKRIELLARQLDVASWSQSAQKRIDQRAARVSSRPYSGTIWTMHVGNRAVPMTGNHLLLCRWADRTTDVCVTYLMYRPDLGFRVGWCKLFNNTKNAKVFHLAQRARLEKAERVWVLKTHATRTEASVHESIVAAQFGLPLITFEPVHGAQRYTRDSIDKVFRALEEKNTAAGVEALHYHDREFDHPIYPWPGERVGEKQGRRTYFLVRASHLLPGLMQVPLPDGQNTWATIDAVETSDFEGDVYSLDVEKDHTYVANGVVVHNCIYEWRNADVKIIRGFPEAFPSATVVKLEQNYRSTGHIVRAALDVIRTSRHRTDKSLWTAADKGREVLIEACDTDRDEGRFVAREIQNARALGRGAAVLAGKLAEPAEPVGTIAILYRTHAVARAIEEPLRDAEIPYVILGGPRFYDRKEVRDVLAYLRLVQNPSSNVDLLRAINVPARGIGAAKVARLEEIARARGQSLWSATAELQGTGELRPREAEGLRAFRELVYQAQSARKTGIGPKRIAEMLIDESGYQKMWQDAAREFAQLGQHDKAEDAMARAENVSEILSAVGAFEDSQKELGRKATLDGYLERVALMTSADKKTEGAVAMMTIHAAKGLEFDKVFVVGCEEGLLPLRPEEGDRALDEERRLMYVACTRARKELTLSWSKVRYVHGKLVPNAPSRFLRAIDPDEYGDS